MFISGTTEAPDSTWVTQQSWSLSMTHLDIDRDTKFAQQFDVVLEAEGVSINRIGPRAHTLNDHVVRFFQTLRTESLDHFAIGIEEKAIPQSR